MENLLTFGNKKYRKYGRKLLTFGLPALKSRTGMLICQFAGECMKGCYAQQGRYLMSPVYLKEERRLQATLRDDFVDRMNSELSRRHPTYVRVHDSGDFYSAEYLAKWMDIARANPGTRFFSYTKAIPLVRAYGSIPKNWFMVYSEGGRCDSMIQRGDTRARIFEDKTKLSRSMWGNGAEHDVELLEKGEKRIGLVYHGAKSKRFSTRKP